MLRSALICNFKDADTLLIWGESADLTALRRGVFALHGGRLPIFLIGGGPGLTAVRLEAALGDGVSLITGTETDAVWRFAPDRLSDLLISLGTLETATSGHHYVDVEGELASQVLISVNEYPASLSR